MTVQELVRDVTQNSRSGPLPGDECERLEAILADYLERLERGEKPDTNAIIVQHSELADELRENLAKLTALHIAAVGMTDGGVALDQLCATNLSELGTLGDFRVIRPIGRGGMGVVYEAEQISLHRRVALKTLPLAGVLNPKQLARFKNEAQAAASLDHPQIVSVYAVGSDRGIHYYAMQFIEGLSLAEVILECSGAPESPLSFSRNVASKGTGASTENQNCDKHSQNTIAGALSTLDRSRPAEYFRSVARLGIQAAEALHYAHEMGVVHRDIKPSNLLLDDDGQLYVTDFGLAMTQSDSNLTMTGDVLGTLRYMSPEQASGRRALVDRRTDIYSLGASLYELATLHAAFPEEDRVRLLHQVITDPPQAPSQINREIPKDLETIILKAMAKEPSSRYESAQELADDLQRFAKLEPIRARRITKLAYARSWCRRNKTVASLLAAVAALLLVLSIGGPLAAIKQAQLTRQANEELSAKNINQLYQDWYSGNVERVGAELERHDETADPGEFLFEWGLLRRLYEDSRKTVIFETEPDDERNFPTFVDFSPVGDLIALGQPGDRVAIYDIKQKELRQLENDPAGGVADAEFSHNGKELITVSWTGVINRRDVATGKVIGPVIHCGVEYKRPVIAGNFDLIRVTPDGESAVIAMGSTVVLARFEVGDCVKIHTHDGSISGLALSPESKTLVSSSFSDGRIKVWDLMGKQPPRVLDSYPSVIDIQFTADSGRLIIPDQQLGVIVLDAVSLAELPNLRINHRQLTNLAVHHDGIVATAGMEDQIVLWDIETGKELATFIGHEGNVADLEFSPDGTSVVSTSDDGTVRLWTVGDLNRKRNDRETRKNWRIDVQFAADGQNFFSSARRMDSLVLEQFRTQLSRWDIYSGQRERILAQGTHPQCDLAVVPGAEQVLCGGLGEFVLKKRSGEVDRVLDNDPRHIYQHVIASSDGKWVAGCGRILDNLGDNKNYFSGMAKVCFVVIVNLKSGAPQFFELPTHRKQWVIKSIAFSPDGNFLVAGGGEGFEYSRVDIFEREGEGFRHHDLPHEPQHGNEKVEVTNVAVSADSRLAGAVNQAGFARIWTLRGPEWKTEFTRESGLFSLAFSPDGRILALGDASGIQLCDLKSGSPLATIPIGGVVRSLRFSPDGRTLAWSSHDGEFGFFSTTAAIGAVPIPVEWDVINK
jgi:serine/threonine protein kinase/WD40 repeat protein